MTLSAEEKGDLAAYRSAKATALLADAEMLLRAGSYASSANRSYYAVLTADRSLQARRMDSDYGDYIEIGEDEARDSLSRARLFVADVERLIKGMQK